MNINAQFTYDKVAHSKENDVHLVVSLTAPASKVQTRRPPICVIPSIDCSGSMGGDKLEYAKQSAIKMIDHLQPGDFFGLVAFSDHAWVVAEIAEITQTKKLELKNKVGQLHIVGGTNFCDGMMKGLEMGKKADLPDSTTVRLIMFTDGQPTTGFATTTAALSDLLKKQRGRVSVSSFGYGAGANQEMLSSLSVVGEGNYAFIKDPEDAMAAFGKELGGLLSTYASNIRVEVAPHNGHRITDVVSDVEVAEKENVVSIKMGDLLSEETRSLVFSVKLSKQTKPLPRQVNVFDIKLSYDTFDENGKREEKAEELKAKIQFVKEGEEQDKATKSVDQVVALAELAKKQIEAEELAQKGQFQAAGAVLASQALDFQSRSLDNFANVAVNYAASVNNAKSYGSSGGYRSSVLRSAQRGSGYTVSSMDKQAEADLACLNVSVSNNAQVVTSSAFSATSEPDDLASIAGSIIVPPPAPDPVVAETKVEVSKSISKSKSKRW